MPAWDVRLGVAARQQQGIGLAVKPIDEAEHTLKM